jgi:flagellar biosynthesis protein FlhA
MNDTEQGSSPFGRADFIIAAALTSILAVLIIPIHTGLLDLLLVLNIALGMLILILTTQLHDPLQLSAFPSLLLLLTLFRLALNVATTRQILMTAFAGNVIQAFGTFVVGGNYVVGIVIFLILVVINFMVITKGSGRIAEVTARFTLDAMPGKQMSIDADLSSGLIDEATALERREKLRREADFYGAMDGASKFVRGDAIAGLIITLINIAGGFTVGMLQRGMDASQALKTYTLLTVGDGLVAQIPALVISTAAGMMVTRAASNDSLGKDISRQLLGKSKPLLTTGGILAAIALVPGLPFLPFLALGGTLAAIGLTRKAADKAEQEKAAVGGGAAGKKLEAGAARGALPAGDDKQPPPVSPMDLEIGFGLVPLVDANQGGQLIERIRLIRSQIAEEMGFVLPPVNVKDNIRLKNTEYSIKVRGIELARGGVRPGLLMAINPGGDAKLEGYTAVREPAFGFEAYWIPKNKREAAEAVGMTVVDDASVITTHLAEESKRHAADILTRQDVSDMTDRLKQTHPSVVEELLPGKMTIGKVHRVLQSLLRERVSIRDLPAILETLADQADLTRDIGLLTEHCRRALGASICHGRLTSEGTLPAIGLHPDLEQMIRQHTKRDGAEIGLLVMPPALAHEVLAQIRKAVETARAKNAEPILLCSPLIRPQVRRLTEHEFRDMAVISFAETPDNINIDILGMAAMPPSAEPRSAAA